MKKITILMAIIFCGISYAQQFINDGGFDNISDPTAANLTTITEGTGATTIATWYSNPNYASTLTIYNGSNNNTAVKLKPQSLAAQLKQNFLLESNTTYVCSFKVMKETSDAVQNQPLKTYIRLKAGSVKQPVDTGTIGEVAATGDQWWIYRDDISSEDFTPVSFQFTTNDNASVDYHIFIALPPGAGDSNLIVDDYSIVEGTLSNNDFTKYNFSYTPNPVNNTINLNAAKTISKVDFYNTLGQNVLTNPINTLNSSVNISAFKKGIYIMNVTINGQTQGFKILKQ